MMGKYEKKRYNYLIYKILDKYTTKCDTLKLHNNNCYTIPKERSTVHKALGYLSQWQTFGHGAEVIHAESYLQIWHP